MRTTIHTVSAREYWLMATGLRQAQRAWWLRLQKGAVTSQQMARRARRVRTALADGPLRAGELAKIAPGYVGLWADFVRVPPSGTWERRRADLYASAESWLGPSDVTEQEGAAHLVRRYLGGFGPASLDDVASWAGVPVTTLRPALERLELRRFFDEEERELLDLPGARLPSPDTPAPVRFLPTWDAILLVHARRTGVLPEEYRPVVFNDKNPPSVPTFLVDGRVAGAWRHTEGRIELEPYERLSRATWRELRREAARLARFLS
jgi:DNA glycosylase AlkZ-like